MKKYNLIYWLGFLAIVLIYFFTRLQNLTILPVFVDEAIYLRWSQVIASVETLRFIPLTDGKQPLFMWLTVPLLKLISDPLFAGRLLSVFAGLINLVFVGFIFKLINNDKNQQLEPTILNSLVPSLKTLLLGLIYVLVPYHFFFDRVALPDNLLTSLLLISTYFFFLQLRFSRLDLAIIQGAFLGLAWLTKSPAFYFLILLQFFTIIYARSNISKKLVLVSITALVSALIYSILRLGPQFHMIALRNQDYVWPLTEILKHPFDPLLPHFLAYLSVLNYYFLPSLLLLLLIILGLTKLKNKYYLILFFLYLLPTLGVLSTAKVFTSRYVLFGFPYLLIFIYMTILALIPRSKTKLAAGLIFIFAIFSSFKLYGLSKDPGSQKLPTNDIGYLQGWTSGWGIKPAAEYLISRANMGKNVIVGTEGAFGTLPDGLQIYLNQRTRLTAFGLGIGILKVPGKLLEANAFGDDVYLLFNRSRLTLPPEEYQKLELVEKYPKPDGDYLELYRVIVKI